MPIIVCGNCGAVAGPGQRFCGQCGSALATTAPDEYRSGAHWVTGRVAIIVGPSGSDLTADGGQTWRGFDEGSFDTVDCAGGWVCWASGTMGRVAYLVR